MAEGGVVTSADKAKELQGLRLLDQWNLACLAHRDTKLSAVALQVFMRLLDHYNRGTGRCDPSIPTLTEAVGRTTRGVQKGLAQLKKRGWIQVIKNGGTRGTNAYRPCFERLDDPEPRPKEEPAPEKETSTQSEPPNICSPPDERLCVECTNARSDETTNKQIRNEERGGGFQRLLPAPPFDRRKTEAECRKAWEAKLAEAVGPTGGGYGILVKIGDDEISRLCMALEAKEVSLAEAATTIHELFVACEPPLTASAMAYERAP